MSNSTAETNEQLWFEQSINAAVYIGAMAWGMFDILTLLKGCSSPLQQVSM